VSWFKCPPHAWEVVADILTAAGAPWDAEAIEGDLAYWADQESHYGRRRPSRRALQRRWCCSEWAARLALSQSPPKPLPNLSQHSPKPTTANAGNEPETSQHSPKPLPTFSQTSPHARSTQTQTADTDKKTPKPPRGLLSILSALRGADVVKASPKTIAEFATFRKKTGATVDEMLLIVDAMKRCPHKLFAYDVRAEGWEKGMDRSSLWGTLIVQRRWEDRLVVATAWTTTPETEDRSADWMDGLDWSPRSAK